MEESVEIKQAKFILEKWEAGGNLEILLNAYKTVFKTDLMPRLESLVSQYGKKESICWELQAYGWGSPHGALLRVQHAINKKKGNK